MNKSSKSLASFAIIIAIFAVAYFGAYAQWQGFSQAKDAHAVSEQKNKELKQAQQDLTDFLAKYDNNQEQVALANKVLPLTKPEIAILLGNLSDMSAQSGMQLTALNIDEPVRGVTPTPQSIQTQDFSLGLTGSFEAFKDFVTRLQNNLRLMDIISASLSSENQTTDAGKILQYTLKIRTYYQP